MVEYAARECSDPDIAVIAGNRRYVSCFEARVKGREPPAVEHQQSLAFGADQDKARTQHQHRGDDSQTRVRRKDLAKARAIEGQQSLATRRDEKFRFRRTGGDPRGHGTEFR
jgi:hypothetical protein